jgi:hypothetical protein
MAIDRIDVDVALCEDSTGSILWMQTPDGEWHVIEFDERTATDETECERLSSMTFDEWRAEAARMIEAAQRGRA